MTEVVGRREYSKLAHENEVPAEQADWIRYNSDGYDGEVAQQGSAVRYNSDGYYEEVAKYGPRVRYDGNYGLQTARFIAAEIEFLPKLSLGCEPQAPHPIFAEVAGPKLSFYKSSAPNSIQFDGAGGGLQATQFKMPIYNAESARPMPYFETSKRAWHAGRHMEWKHDPLRTEKV